MNTRWIPEVQALFGRDINIHIFEAAMLADENLDQAIHHYCGMTETRWTVDTASSKAPVQVRNAYWRKRDADSDWRKEIHRLQGLAV